MTRKCSVPCCRSNYDGTTEKVSTFKFPEDENLRKKWIQSINRQDFSPGKYSYVCAKHFQPELIIHEDRCIRPDGSELIVKRKYPKLAAGAYPSIFPNQPAYLSKNLPVKRKTPEEREKEKLERDEKRFLLWCETDNITDFETFKASFKEKIDGEWIISEKSDYVLLFKINDVPQIFISVKIFSNLTVDVHFDNVSLLSTKFKFVLGDELVCNKWTKFVSLLSHLNGYKATDLTITDKVNAICQQLELISNEDVNNDEGMNNNNFQDKIKFLHEQCCLLLMNKPRYSAELLTWCCYFFYCNPSSFKRLLDCKFLTLPSASYLRKFSRKIDCVSTGVHNSLQKYLTEKCATLREDEKIVNLLLDEIYIKPGIVFKGGKVIGLAEDKVNYEATTVQTFMISSIFSSNKDVVAMYPVKNLNTEQLLNFTLQVINYVQTCGYIILTVISDNNKVNYNMFQMLCGGELNFKFQNPVYRDKYIFILFDTVHLFKSIRNNWMNQKATNQTFFIPSFDDHQKQNTASILHLKKMYDLEKDDYVKLCPALSRKVLFPTSFERQNVATAVKLFDEKTIAALEIESHKNLTGFAQDVPGTKHFIEIISKWWKIMNVKHPKKGKRFRDSCREPIYSMNDENILFLQSFCDWLERWSASSTQSSSSRSGKLSIQTETALIHTTRNIINVCDYILATLKKSYVLLGKLQTDNLEGRFGQYRQMSGANYNVSLSEILDSERKLKVISLLKLNSFSNGNFFLKSFNCNDSEQIIDDELLMQYENLFMYTEEILVTDKDTVNLVYIGGYVCKFILKSIKCSYCREMLVKDKELEVEYSHDSELYLRILDRGGLKWPTEFVIMIVENAYKIFQVLISELYENIFLSEKNQQSVLVKLIVETITTNLGELSVCSCGTNISVLIEKASFCISNILLNNYCKVRNDKSSVKRMLESKLKKERKLNTLNSK